MKVHYEQSRHRDSPGDLGGEDLARDVARALNQESRVSGYAVEAKNFESINHSAFARIVRSSLAAGSAQSGKPQDQRLHLLSTAPQNYDLRIKTRKA